MRVVECSGVMGGQSRDGDKPGAGAGRSFSWMFPGSLAHMSALQSHD